MKKIILLVTILALCAQVIFSQESKNQELITLIEESYKTDIPIWLMMERGKQAFAIGEYGLASRVFREVIDRQKVYPDAEVWLAYIFEQEGELDLAEKQYLKALENKNDLYVPEDEVEVLYRLAEIYRKTDQYGKYEATLLKVVEKDPQEDLLNLQYSMMDAVKKHGIDKMFELYRYHENRYNRARKELGIFYYQTGRYADAEINLVIPLVSDATTGFDYIYEKTADYDYKNFKTHVGNMVKYEKISTFLSDDGFFETSYYLAAALYADGYYKSAEYLWKIVTEFDTVKSTWKIRALRQLEDPYIEPIITHRS